MEHMAAAYMKWNVHGLGRESSATGGWEHTRPSVMGRGQGHRLTGESSAIDEQSMREWEKAVAVVDAGYQPGLAVAWMEHI